MTDLVSQALSLLQAGAHVPDVPEEWQRTARDGLIGSLTFARLDHATERCPFADGECYAVQSARRIIEEATK